MKSRVVKVVLVAVVFVGLFIYWQPVSANQDGIYPADPGTIELGKQGLFIKNLPSKIEYVEIERIRSLKYKYTIDVEITFRGPGLEITFLNKYKSVDTPVPTQTSVYFNISEPEVKLWEEGGSNEIGILYYNKKSEEWLPCYTRFIPEKLNNGKYDRLACMVMGNGIYILGKMEFDPSFTEWFRPYDIDPDTYDELMGRME